MQQAAVRRPRPAPLVAVLAVLAFAMTLLAPAPAQAAPPVPATPDFPAAIEGYAPYQGGDICEPVDRPGAKQLARLIRATYGQDESIGIARNACYTTSEHNDGRALDWMNDASNDADRAQVKAFLQWLLATDDHGNEHAMARRLGVMYIIWNRRIWRSYAPDGWGEYTYSNPHTDHVHISLSIDGASGRTSFWTGRPLAGPCEVPYLSEPVPRLVTAPTNFVPIAATRVLSTRNGVGSLNGACRLFAPQEYGGTPTRVDAQVTGVGAVPSTGVAAVSLQVTMSKPTWASSLTAGPAGGTMPSVRRVSASMNQTSTTSMVLPVGADGKVSFATSYAATDLVVSVVGFYLDPAAPESVVREVASDGGDRYHALAATRLQSGTDRAMGAGDRRRVVVAGVRGVDPAASAAVLSVTVGSGSGRGSLFVYPAGAERPAQALVEYGRSAQTVQTTVPLGNDGAVVVENVGKAGRPVDVDLVGSYEPQALAGGLGFASKRKPEAVVSTRSNLGIRRLDGGVAKTFSVADAVPPSTRAVLLQVTVRDASASTQLVFWDGVRERPGTVDLSAGPRRTVTGLVVAPVDEDGRVSVFATGGTDLDLKVAVAGSFR